MGNTNMKRIAITGAFLLSSLFTLNAAAQLSGDDAAKAVADRQAVFKLLSVSNAPLGAMARGGEFDAEAATLAAERVATLAGLIPQLLEPNTAGYEQPNPGRYAAADTIWDNKADFDQLAADLAAGAEEALGILESQGADGVRAAVGAIGPKCGACHDRFRVEL